MKIALRSFVFLAVLVLGLSDSGFSGGGPVPTSPDPAPTSPGQTV